MRGRCTERCAGGNAEPCRRRCWARDGQPARTLTCYQGRVLSRPAGGSQAAGVYRSLVRLCEWAVLFALKARLITHVVSDTTTSMAAAETVAEMTASARTTHFSSGKEPAGRDPSGRGSERAPSGGERGRHVRGQHVAKLRQRDRPRFHCKARDRREQRTPNSCSVASR